MSVARTQTEAPTCNSRGAELAQPPRASALEIASVASVVGASSPELRSALSVRGVLVASQLRFPVASDRRVPASSVLRCVASRGVASPKFVVSPALHSIRLAVRARKVSRLARRFDGIAHAHKRQQL